MSELTIKIGEDNLCKVFIESDNGTKVKKTVTFTQVLSLMNACSRRETSRVFDEFEETEIYPCDNMVSMLQVRSYDDSQLKWYILMRHGVPVDFEYFGTTYKNVGMPKTIFAVQVAHGKVMRFKVVCVKDIFVTSESLIYCYPFSNVGESGHVCTGANSKALNLPVDSKNIYNLMSIPEMFLAIPNTEHNYGHNLSELYYRDLLRELEGKPFNNEWLKPNGMTFGNFVNSLTK